MCESRELGAITVQTRKPGFGACLEEVLEWFTYPNPPLDLNLYSHSLSSFELAALSGICLNVGKNFAWWWLRTPQHHSIVQIQGDHLHKIVNID